MRIVLFWFPILDLQSPSSPWPSATPSLTIQTSSPILHGYRSELSSLSHPSLVPITIKRRPSLSVHMCSITFLICPFLLRYFRKGNVPLLPLPSNTCLWASAYPILCGAEQTAMKSDLDLNPRSNILQLLPAPLLPEYGVCIVIISNCKFHQLSETTTWHTVASKLALVPMLVWFSKHIEFFHSFCTFGHVALPEISLALFWLGGEISLSCKIFFKCHTHYEGFLEYNALLLNTQEQKEN